MPPSSRNRTSSFVLEQRTAHACGRLQVDAEALKTLVCPPTEEGMMTVRGVYRWRHFGDYTPTGVLGVPAAVWQNAPSPCPPISDGSYCCFQLQLVRHIKVCVLATAQATAEKGERLFDAAAEGIAEALLAPDEEWAHGSHVYPSPGNHWLAFHRVRLDKGLVALGKRRLSRHCIKQSYNKGLF